MKCEVKLFCKGNGLHGTYLKQLQLECFMMWPAGEAVPEKKVMGTFKGIDLSVFT